MHVNDLLGTMVFFQTQEGEKHGHVTDANIRMDEARGLYVELEVRTEGEHVIVYGSEVTNHWKES